jgi:hypothetical protein
MKRRCLREKDSAFPRYGGRGIKVCDRWLESFLNFYSDMGDCPDGYTLDRWPDNNGDYEPSNCRWATVVSQANNKRNNRIVEIGGIRKTAAEWAREIGVRPKLIHDRLRRKWPLEKLLKRPAFLAREKTAEICSMVASGNMHKTVALKFGISRTFVTKLVHEQKASLPQS